MKNTLVALETGFFREPPSLTNVQKRDFLRRKIETFCANGSHPQTLTGPRDPVMIGDGKALFRTLRGRHVGGYREDGVRVVIQENLGFGTKATARFVMSPLFQSEADAMAWARQNGVS